MGKKSREKKQRQLQRRGLHALTRPLGAGGKTPPAAQVFAERVRRGWEHYPKDSYIRIMLESHILRNEPEFRNLSFDLDLTNQVSSRWMSKYEKQLPEIRKKSLDERRAFYDQVRIEMIEDLATPHFRQTVLSGLEKLSQRLANSPEADKFEMGMVLQAILRETKIPWGACGLVTAIFEDSAEKAHQQLGNDLADYEGILRAAEQEEGLEQLLTQPGSPMLLQAVQRTKDKPGLVKYLEQETDQAIRKFEGAIADGKVELDLFTVEELQRPYEMLGNYVSKNQVDLEMADRDDLQRRLVENIRDTIVNLMTKDRIKEMKDVLNRLSAEWLRARNWQAALLHVEVFWLESAKPVENPFLYAVYVGQLKRWREAHRDTDAVPDKTS